MNRLSLVVLLALLMAPYPRGIALNHETRECGAYWRGDEYGTTALPDGWTDYYPDSQGMVHTEVGDCDIRSDAGVEGCCKELGYAYVGSHVGTSKTSPLMVFALGYYLCLGILVLLGLATGLVVLVLVVRYIRRRRQREQADAP